MQIDGSVVLISGSSSGLGAACAKRLIQHGARVVGIDLAAAPSWADSEPKNYWHLQGDVTEAESIHRLVHTMVTQIGKLNAVVCCAGILHGERVLGRVGPASLESFSRVLDVNVNGTFNVVRVAADAISKSEPSGADGERGVVVMTSSVAAFDGQIGQAAYSASKGAIASMTLPLARELGRFGIRVVSLAPGVFETPMMQAASEKVRQPLLDQSVFPKRFGHPEEFAAMVQHVLENPMLNGSTLRLDGALRM